MTQSETTRVYCKKDSIIRMKKLLSKKNGYLHYGDMQSSITTAVDEFNKNLEAELNKRSDE